MMLPSKFTYPFRYTPHPLIEDAAMRLIKRIDATPALRELFSEGKMMGVLMVADASLERISDDDVSYLYAFSGTVGGLSVVDGFVPPVFDLLDPANGYREREAEISAMSGRIALSPAEEAAVLCQKRKSMSESLQKWIFDHYIVSNALGESLSVCEVFARQGLVPPGGTGDCAAPKLLQYAYVHGLKPIAMGEFWYGASPASEVREQGRFYPSCTGKCGPLLAFMLQGLEVEPNPLESDAAWNCPDPSVVYEDECLVVADKPSGMLCVPGRTGRESLQQWLSVRIGTPLTACHRLDMDTSGLVVFAKDERSLVSMQRQFAERQVGKTYSARLLPGRTLPRHGFVRLPLSLDYYDRPRQIVDREHGKSAVTEYELVRELPDGEVDVLFTPHTGRTHQLRVHAAHKDGLGRPIKGDKLYGGGGGNLHLRACRISFTHPLSGELVTFEV